MYIQQVPTNGSKADWYGKVQRLQCTPRMVLLRRAALAGVSPLYIFIKGGFELFGAVWMFRLGACLPSEVKPGIASTSCGKTLLSLQFSAS